MKLKEKLAKEHAQSEGDNGNAEQSFLAGFDAAIKLFKEREWFEIPVSDIDDLGEEEDY